jgi:hypothetical protein
VFRPTGFVPCIDDLAVLRLCDVDEWTEKETNRVLMLFGIGGLLETSGHDLFHLPTELDKTGRVSFLPLCHG